MILFFPRLLPTEEWMTLFLNNAFLKEKFVSRLKYEDWILQYVPTQFQLQVKLLMYSLLINGLFIFQKSKYMKVYNLFLS